MIISDQELKDICTKFNLDKSLILGKYISKEYKIYKYAYIKILVKKGYSKNQIALNLYNSNKNYRCSKSFTAISNGLRMYDKLIQYPGNKSIKDFVNNYK